MRFELLTAVNMTSLILQNVTSCLLKLNFRGIHYFVYTASQFSLQ